MHQPTPTEVMLAMIIITTSASALFGGMFPQPRTRIQNAFGVTLYLNNIALLVFSLSSLLPYTNALYYIVACSFQILMILNLCTILTVYNVYEKNTSAKKPSINGFLRTLIGINSFTLMNTGLVYMYNPYFFDSFALIIMAFACFFVAVFCMLYSINLNHDTAKKVFGDDKTTNEVI